MAANSSNPPTKTIAFRLNSNIVDEITRAAKEKKVKVQEYIIAQIDPISELGQILRVEQEKVLLRRKQVADAAIDFITGLTEIKEKNGLDDEAFSAAIKQSFEQLIKQKTTTNTDDADQED